MSKGTPSVRYAEVERETAETRVRVVLDLDGGLRRDVSTGIGFFDHMLDLFAFHGQLNLGVQAEGDLAVDDHHTVEDVGIVLGKTVRRALAESDAIVRYASNHTPMDEALVLVALDISGRGLLCFEAAFRGERIGGLATQSVKEFFQAFAHNACVTLHIRQIAGENDHHVAEAMFKGLGQALHAAVQTINRPHSSTKGKID